MINFYLKNKDSIEEIIVETSYVVKINEAFVEKDMWVCMILQYLFNECKYKNNLIFTGGTCLSKSYNCINRFSEDIDIAIDCNVIGYKDDVVFNANTISKRDRIVKKIKKSTESFMINVFIPMIKKDLRKLFKSSINFKITYENESVCIHYPALFKNSYVHPKIRIEIGALGIMKPFTNTIVKSYIEEANNINKLEKIKVKSIILERIFWDKVTILHQEAHRSEDKKLPPRNARHYYDLYCLGQFKNVKNNAIKNRKLLKSVIESKNYFYYRSWAKYEECLEKKIKLLPPSYNVSKLKEDYKQMVGMFLTPPPSFDKILEYLKKLEKELNE